MPKSLLVIGSGAIGIEFASFYNTLGVNVTVAEVMGRILPVEDRNFRICAKRARKAGNDHFNLYDCCRPGKRGRNGNGVSRPGRDNT